MYQLFQLPLGRGAVSFSHTGSLEQATRPSLHAWLPRGGKEPRCLNAHSGKLRLLIVSPPSARKQGGGGAGMRQDPYRCTVYGHRAHQPAGQPSPHTWAVLCLLPMTFRPPSMRRAVTHHVPGHSSAWCRQAGPSGGFSSPNLRSCLRTGPGRVLRGSASPD